HESTASRAYLLDRELEGIRVFGGIVLNSYVGGINPAAAEAALKLGAKQVWMPTVDGAYHAQIHGGTGAYDAQAGGRRSTGKGLSPLDGERPTAETLEVLDLISEHGAILGTCHLSPEEIRALLRAARERKVEKVLLTHPYFKVPAVDLSFIKEMVALGAVAEFGYCTVSPMWAYASVEKVALSIKELGAGSCVLVSDCGQRHNPMPPEGLRLFVQSLFEKGISEREIETMVVKNPRALLGLD
ncbi:MAG: hypothetical protein GWO44_17740, partial [Thermoplasmata archaeon]|nr:hypothetical protein [Thermoplasmata archaeon]NIY05042.1 hypothetical protein [Thermoplasmata archaeon]